MNTLFVNTYLNQNKNKTTECLIMDVYKCHNDKNPKKLITSKDFSVRIEWCGEPFRMS